MYFLAVMFMLSVGLNGLAGRLDKLTPPACECGEAQVEVVLPPEIR